MGSLYLGYRTTVLPEGMQVSGREDPVIGGDKDMCPSVKQGGSG